MFCELTTDYLGGFNTFKRKFMESREFFAAKELEPGFKELPGSQDKKCFVYLDHGRVSGYGFFAFGGGTASIGLCLLPQCQGKGVGRKFLDFLEEQIVGYNISEATALVDKSNWKSLLLFANNGYRVRREDENYLHLWKTL